MGKKDSKVAAAAPAVDAKKDKKAAAKAVEETKANGVTKKDKKDKKDKKSKKEPTPEPESDSDSSEEEESSDSDCSDSSSDSDSSSSSEEKKKKDVKAEPKTNGKAAAAATTTTEVSSSSSSDSSDSDSDSSDDEDSTPAADSKKRKADDETPVTKKAKTEEPAAATTELAEGETNQIWVGQLSWNVDNDWLKSEMEVFGQVTSARVQLDRTTGKSRGFGYVDFATAAAAKKAFEEGQGKQVDGRAIRIDLSTPKGDVSEDRAKKFNDQRSAPSSTLFIGNLSFDITEDDVWNAFSEHGEVSSVRLPKDPDSGRPKGFGYVEFAAQESAAAAIDAMTGQELAGRPLRLDFSTPRDRDGGAPRGGGRGGAFGGGRGGGRGGGFGGGRGGGGGFGGGRGGGGRGGGRGGRGGSSDGSFRGMARGGGWGQRGGSARTGGAADFSGKKMTFDD